MVAEKPKAI